jgi:hypothetical protein
MKTDQSQRRTDQGTLKQGEAGMKMMELCRHHGSAKTRLQLESDVRRYGVRDVRKLKRLEIKRAKLKWVVADTMPDKVMLKELLSKNF